MDPRQELEELRRLDELEAKAGGKSARSGGAMGLLKSAGTGLLKAGAGVADLVTQASPVGIARNMFQMAGNLASNHPTGKMPNPFSGASQMAEDVGYKPQTGGERFAEAVGRNLPNAFIPGSSAARFANVVLPTVGEEAGGAMANGMGYGEKGQAVGRTVGAIAGGGAASVRLRNPFAGPAPTTSDTFAKRARLDPAKMRAKTDEMRAAGVQPTPTDIVGEKGRRLIRAVGVKSEDGGEALTQRARETAAITKPAVIARTRRLHPDPRTATQYADDTEAARGTEATANYATFDNRPVQVPASVLDMLADGPGRSILARAKADATERQDWARVAEIDRLAQHKPGEPLPRITAGTLDKISGAARDRGTAFAARPGGNTRAAGAYGRRAQIDETLDAVDELKPTRAAFREKSTAIDVARDKTRVDPFTTDPADYGRWLQSLPPAARNANRIAIRQDILDTLGGQRQGTLGTLDSLATSPYARDNLRQAFGADADQFAAEISARLEQTRNASFVEPNAGSRTTVLANDAAETAKTGVQVARQAARFDLPGLAVSAIDMWTRRGISKVDAEAIARIAVDQNATDQIVAAAMRRLNTPARRQEFMNLRNAATVGGLSLATGSARP